jgi:hypothetical protein
MCDTCSNVKPIYRPFSLSIIDITLPFNIGFFCFLFFFLNSVLVESKPITVSGKARVKGFPNSDSPQTVQTMSF